MRYVIFQLPMSNKAKFRSYDEFKNELKIYDYVRVYVGTTSKLEYEDISSLLEDIYEQLNVNPPIDYFGHSLSMSDVIRIDDDYYYCDDIGWVKIAKENFV